MKSGEYLHVLLGLLNWVQTQLFLICICIVSIFMDACICKMHMSL